MSLICSRMSPITTTPTYQLAIKAPHLASPSGKSNLLSKSQPLMYYPSKPYCDHAWYTGTAVSRQLMYRRPRLKAFISEDQLSE